MKSLAHTFGSLFLVSSLLAESPAKQAPLWEGPAPQSHGSALADTPRLLLFPAPKSDLGPAAAVVICPGGGYRGLSMVKEGANVAGWFQAHGVSGFVLVYRLPVNGYLHPVPLGDAQRAIRLVRSHSADWNVDPAKVGIMGFSAGGHLASTAETHFDAGLPRAADPVDRFGSRPDFAILAYPVITMKDPLAHKGSRDKLLGPNPDPALLENLSNETQVTAETPPTYLIAALDDRSVPPENSRMFYKALQDKGVDGVLKLLPSGGHGFGYSQGQSGAPAGWLDGVGAWMKAHHWMR